MFSRFSPERLARSSARRPWIVVGVWTVLLVAGAYFATGISDVLTTDGEMTVKVESERADDLILERLRGGEAKAAEQVIVRSDTLTVDDPAFEAKVDDVLGGLRGLDTVETATSYYETKVERLVSDDRHTTILPVVLVGSEDDAADHAEPVITFVKSKDGAGGFDVLTAGDGSIERAWLETAEKDFSGEFRIGLPMAILVLIVVFGAIVAAGVPIVLSLLSIVIAIGITAIIGQAFELSTFVLNMISMIGLAVGIDYSLFIVERYREERRRGLAKVDAVAAAGASAGRAVLLAGITVVVALCGLLIVPNTIYRSLAAGAIVVAIVAIGAALTLLPAVLSLLGDRVNWLRLPFVGRRASDDRQAGVWATIGRAVMGKPIVSVAASFALLGALSLPYFTIELGHAGVSTLPKSIDAFRGFEILDEEFTAGLIAPAEIVVDAQDVNSADVQAATARLQEKLVADDAFGASTVERNQAGDLAVISVAMAGDPQENQAHSALNRLRDGYIPDVFGGTEAEVLVTGPTAETSDFVAVIDGYTPVVFAFVLGLSFLVLLVVFRSIVVPVKALIMNLLSVGASYGLLVAVFQRGWGNELLGFQQVDRIEGWLPLFLFAVLFGLSMDYHVFLLSRIRERFDETRDNAGSVAFGLRSTGGIITGAALIMVAVFSGFALGQLVAFQQMGFGLAIAVILDATLVRSVLVPASMVLLGDWNWYLPKWLSWLPQVRIERPATAASAAATAVAGAD